MLHRLPSLPFLRLAAAVVALLLPGSAIVAVETESTPAQQEMLQEARTLYPQLLENDLWTTLLWEGWAKDIPHHPTPTFFGQGVEVLGSTRFALPEDIHGVKDRGASVEVVTGHRWYCFAPDGHPIQVPVPLNLNAEVKEAAFSYEPGVVAVATYNSPNDTVPLTVNWTAHVLTTKGAEVLTVSGTEDKIESYRDTPMVIAEDGSAVMQVFTAVPHAPYGVVSTHAEAHRVIDNVLKIYGVGTEGRWLLVQSAGDEGPTLIQGTTRTHLRTGAAGPGCAAIVRDDGQPEVIGADGTSHPLLLPIALGKNVRMLAVAGYLVVASGSHALSLDNTDLFGQPLANPPEQPETCACIPWDEVKAGTIDDAITFPGTCSDDWTIPGRLFVWKDRLCWTVDLLQRPLQRRPFYEAPDHIGWVSGQRYWDRVEYGQGASAVLDADGHELWSGAGYVDPWSPTIGILGTGDGDAASYSIVRLSPDPKARGSTRLSLDAGSWDFTYDLFNHVFLARGSGRWVQFDDTGNQLNPPSRKGTPEMFECWFPPGRFFVCGSRLVPRDRWPLQLAHPEHPNPQEEIALSDEMAGMLVPADAWITGQRQGLRVEVLHAAHRLWMAIPPYHKPWLWQDLGACPGSRTFGSDRRGEALFVCGSAWGMVVKSVTEEGLSDDFANTHSSPLPAGPWQATSPWQDFTPRNTNNMRWSADVAGFMPLQLRSPPAYDQGLLVVTPSLVLIMARDLRALAMVTEGAGRNRR